MLETELKAIDDSRAAAQARLTQSRREMPLNVAEAARRKEAIESELRGKQQAAADAQATADELLEQALRAAEAAKAAAKEAAKAVAAAEVAKATIDAQVQIAQQEVDHALPKALAVRRLRSSHPSARRPNYSLSATYSARPLPRNRIRSGGGPTWRRPTATGSTARVASCRI